MATLARERLPTKVSLPQSPVRAVPDRVHRGHARPRSQPSAARSRPSMGVRLANTREHSTPPAWQ